MRSINSDVSITSDIVRRSGRRESPAISRSSPIRTRTHGRWRARSLRPSVSRAPISSPATRLATKLMATASRRMRSCSATSGRRVWIPAGHASLMSAIELQGVAVAATKAAFLWGRRAAHDRAVVEAVGLPPAAQDEVADTLEALVARRITELTLYQDAAYARALSQARRCGRS